MLKNDTDANGDTLTAALNANVAHGTLALSANGSFIYMPNAGYTGPDTFTYHASDGTASSNVATVTITVDVVNHAPTAVNDAFNVNEDSSANSFNVLANDTDPDAGDTKTVTATGATNHGGTVSIVGAGANNTLSYTPAAGYVGSEAFTYTMRDTAGLTSTATVTVTVASVNHAPTAVNDAFNVNQDSSANSFNVLANDTDTDAGDTKSITATGATNHGGTVSIVGAGANNTLSYTPAAAYVGSETFTYTMRDTAGLTSTATVTVTVASVNHAPTAVNDPFTVNQDTSANSFNVLANDTDPDTGDTKTITATGATNHGGTVSIVGAGANNTLSYTPAAGYVGAETFTYTMRDTAGLTSTATVTVTVASVNHAPIAVNDPVTVNQDTSANSLNVLANDTDPDAGDTKTITTVGATDHGGTVSIVGAGANNTLSYTPAAGYVGPETFTYTMRDTGGPHLHGHGYRYRRARRPSASRGRRLVQHEQGHCSHGRRRERRAQERHRPGCRRHAHRRAQRERRARNTHAEPQRLVHVYTGGRLWRARLVHVPRERRHAQQQHGHRLAHRQRPRAGRQRRLLHHERGHAARRSPRTACSRTTPTRTPATR